MTASPAARAEAHSQTHLVEQVRDVASRVADVDDHVVVHLAADALDAQARLIEEAREVIESLLEQAVGCAMNHYPGEPEYCEGAHIQDARAFLTTLPAKGSSLRADGAPPKAETQKQGLSDE